MDACAKVAWKQLKKSGEMNTGFRKPISISICRRQRLCIILPDFPQFTPLAAGHGLLSGSFCRSAHYPSAPFAWIHEQPHDPFGVDYQTG